MLYSELYSLKQDAVEVLSDDTKILGRPWSSLKAAALMPDYQNTIWYSKIIVSNLDSATILEQLRNAQIA